MVSRTHPRRRGRQAIAVTAAIGAIGIVGTLQPGGVAHAAVTTGPALALTDANTLIGFDVAAPTTITRTVPITGLTAGESIVGIDVRPASGQMYAVGVAGTTGRLYTLNTTSGAATLVGAGPFSTALPTGGTWSVDFNPVADRIRFVHSSGVSYRLNQLTGTVAATDTSVAPAVPDALAYDRSVTPTPSATTLFAIDATTDTLNRIGGVDGTPSPNTGATTPVGALGVDAAQPVGFDIAPQGDALATLRVGGVSALYSINLTSGAATGVGTIGDGTLVVRDLALPRPPAGPMTALAPGNQLVAFDASAPTTVTTRAITGLIGAESIVGIDTRPATGELIGVGIDGTNGHIYRIDRTTGAATPVSATAFQVAAAAPRWSVDFNPTVDRIRLVASTGASYRLNPVNGAVAGTDTAIAPAKPSAVAYDRPIATTAATTLFLIDDVAETLNVIGGVDGTPSPNTGVTSLRGPLGVVTDTDAVGFDISSVGDAVATLNVGGSTGLYTIDLVAGTARFVSAVGTGTTPIIDIAFGSDVVAGASQFTAVTPTRVLDTRTGGAQKPAPGSTLDVQIAGVAGVPATATAVVLNATGTEATGDGFVTVFPTGEPLPLASNQNLLPGQTRANLVTVKLGAGGKVSMYTQSGTHLVADVFGYYAPPTGTAGRFTALTPSRLIDTRQTTKVAADSSVDVAVLGNGGVPATGVSSVLVNIAATEANLPGFITAYASGTPRPGTSNLNLERADSTASNLAIVPVGADGKITVYTQQGAHIVVDVAGWFGDATAKGGPSGLFVPVSPSRILDTRVGTGAPAGALPIDTGIELTVAGVGGVPAAGASSALLNLTSVESIQRGFVTVYPVGSALTAVSSLNVDVAGQTTPNLVGATLGTGGRVAIYDQAGGHLVADVAGWFTR